MPAETIPSGEQGETRGNRISLKTVTDDDVDSILGWAKAMDPEYLRQTGPETGDIYSSADSLRAVINNGRVVFQDILAGDNRVGNIFLAQKTLKSRRAELGFIIDQQEQGKGYAKEAVAAMSRFAFDELQMDSLIARTSRHNKASANALYAAGFNMVFPSTSADGTLLVFKRFKEQPVRGYRVGYLSPAFSKSRHRGV